MRILKRKTWPYRIRLDNKKTNTQLIETWLIATLGANKDHWNVVYHDFDPIADYYFKSKGHASLFALKWL